eukprot:gene1395-1998_t
MGILFASDFPESKLLLLTCAGLQHLGLVLYEGVGPGVMSSGKDIAWTSGTLAIYDDLPDAASLGITVNALQADQHGSAPPRTRECGSPAVGAYAHVDIPCLESSITAKDHPTDPTERLRMAAHIEDHADYDGLAVVWGIGNKKPSAEACADACRRHQPGTLHFEQCFEADAHTHRAGDCWLKFTEVPESMEV